MLARSHVWETAPVGGPAQPDYLNAALAIGWSGTPDALLDALLAIEADLGRVRAEKDGPRTIDLDVLWMEGVVTDGARLVIPHPRLSARAFAVAPLLEVAPDARDPATNAPYVVPAGEVRRRDERL